MAMGGNCKEGELRGWEGNHVGGSWWDGIDTRWECGVVRGRGSAEQPLRGGQRKSQALPLESGSPTHQYPGQGCFSLELVGEPD